MSWFERLMERMGFDFIVVNWRNIQGGTRVVVSHYADDRSRQDEVLKREIPLWFLLLVKLRRPFTPLFVRGLVTQAQIDSELLSIRGRW